MERRKARAFLRDTYLYSDRVCPLCLKQPGHSNPGHNCPGAQVFPPDYPGKAFKDRRGEKRRREYRKLPKQINCLLESYIRRYPQEYFWFYKIWKYSPFRKVVVLSDGKAGHLRQAQAVVNTVVSRPEGRGWASDSPGHCQPSAVSQMIEIKFKNKFLKSLAQAAKALGLDLWEVCLEKDCYQALRMNTCRIW